MLKKMFIGLCVLFGREDRLSSVELIAMISTVAAIVVTHILFLVAIFNFEMTYLIEEYGAVMLSLSFIVFSCLYFWLIKKFKAYAK